MYVCMYVCMYVYIYIYIYIYIYTHIGRQQLQAAACDVGRGARGRGRELQVRGEGPAERAVLRPHAGVHQEAQDPCRGLRPGVPRALPGPEGRPLLQGCAGTRRATLTRGGLVFLLHAHWIRAVLISESPRLAVSSILTNSHREEFPAPSPSKPLWRSPEGAAPDGHREAHAAYRRPLDF